jgi:penicillin-insensitive murein endopeptidase
MRLIKQLLTICILFASVFMALSPCLAEESICYGTTSKGALENACKLPEKGANFNAYSSLGTALGRTYLHCSVSDVVVEAYEVLSAEMPDKTFVYGETGWAKGGRFKPHKTHQNGLSVDFMVPVIDGKGNSVPLPTSAFNKYGYSLEFDDEGRIGELTIDFEAIASHILTLMAVADENGIGIWRVIFAPELQPFIKQTKAWLNLEGKVEFSKRKSWVRHDEHYHIDFTVPCRSLRK